MIKLLVIDDDINTCDLLQKFLAKHGFTVITTTNAKKAMEYLDDINLDSNDTKKNLFLILLK